MKGNKKILTIAILLFLISAGLTTYAIYKSSVTASTTVNLAGCHVELQYTDVTQTASTTLTYTLSDANCTRLNGKAGTIAPGDTCTITVPVDLTGSQVDAVVTASLGTINNLPTGMTVTLGSTSPVEIEYDEDDMSTDIVINIAWATEDSTTRNPADVSAQGREITIPLNLTAAQQNYNN